MCYYIKIISISLLYLNCNNIFSQNDTIDDTFIVYDEKIIFGFTLQENSDTFFLGYKNEEDAVITKFTPNIEKKLNINFKYKIIDFSIGTTPNFLKTNIKQKSSNFNLVFRFNFKRWTQSLTFINQKGFYIDGKNIGKNYFPQLRSTKIGTTTSYVTNDKFSYKTIFNQNQWQKKSAGSFVSHFSFYYTNIRSKKKADNFYTDIYSLTISPSYYYNFVVNKNFLIGAGANLGFGVNIVNNNLDPLIELSTNLRIGYNTESFFSFIGYNGTSFGVENNNESYNNTFSSFKLEVGYRFDTPKKVKKAYDHAIKTIPISL